MSLKFLNSPPLVTGAGVALMAGLPLVNVGAISVGALKLANVVAYATNVVAVSIPGRMDGDQDARMRSGELNPNAQTPLTGSETSNNIVQAGRDRTLVAPAGWAFAIWGPIYLGEAALCGAQYFDPTIGSAVPDFAVPFVVANLTQSLWCASFRASYSQGWHKYVSVGMLGGTALALSQIPFATVSSAYFIPLAMHFGWTTAATLVNFNGSVAMNESVREQTLISVGHASSVIATALGIGMTLNYSLPTYGLTVAWALAACSNGMRVKPGDNVSQELQTGAKVQKVLLATGSLLSAGAAFYTMIA